LVQCIFQDLEAASHYIGGEPAPQSVWVFGHIRDGRDEEVRERILIRIPELFVNILQIDPSLTPGAEQQWIEQMPSGLRERLLELNERAPR
jgi:hypothetical protein